MKNTNDLDRALKANIEVHSKLANTGEYNRSPHFRRENKDKVRKILKDIVSSIPCSSGLRALDMGCGTGFIIDLVHDLVDEVHGIDITADMMNKIDLTPGNILLKKTIAENTGYKELSFDLVTAYSFLDHLIDYTVVLEEAYRVLKEGGIFYSDLNPNRRFSNLMADVESDKHPTLPHMLEREIRGILNNGQYYEDNFGIDRKALEDAEPGKTINRGFDVREVEQVALNIGFKKVTIEFDWFLGQGYFLNDDKSLSIKDVEKYLNAILPASEPLFKYLRFVFVK